MSFDINSKANIAFKKLLGKAHTSNDRDPANEPFSTIIQVSAQNIWGQKLHPDPNDPSNIGKVAHGDGVSFRIKFNLVPISGTNSSGKYSSYYVTVPDPVPSELSTKINPLTGQLFASGDRVGNLIPETFGFNYIAKPFSNNIEIPPSDASDWVIDYYSGILTQETDVTSAMIDYTLSDSRLEAYVYIGEFVSDTLNRLDEGGLSYTFYDYQTIGNGITGTIDGINKIYILSNTPDVGSVYVYVNGILQLPNGNDYSVSGSTITFTNPLQVGDILIVSYRKTTEY